MSQLPTQLVQLENYAEVLEKRVYKKLCGLEKMRNPISIQQEEGQILTVLQKLDEMQEEIDGIKATLKAQGLNVVVSYEGNVYRAKPKKIKAPPKPKPERKPEPKVYPIESPTPAKLRAKKAGMKLEEMEARTKERAERQKVREAEKLAAQEARERRAEAKRAKAASEAARKATQAALAAERLAKALEQEAAKKAVREARQAEKLAQQVERLAEREAARAARAAEMAKPKPKNVRPPKAKPAPKPRKPRESDELRLAKKRRDSIQMRLGKLDDQIEKEHQALLARLEERKARVHAVRNTPPEQNGNQKRADAKKNLANVEAQLNGLAQRKQERWQSLTDQLEQANQDIQSLIENDSQLV
jgi:colicin import membrane protein